MRLAGDGTVVDLEPVSYQFPGTSRDRHDANWLIVAGHVETSGRSWNFRDACLLTWEAAEVSGWLRGVAHGSVKPTKAEDEDHPSLIFLEPDLAFSLAERDERTARLRVHLSLEAGPPWLSAEERGNIWQFFVQVPVSVGLLDEIADRWDREMAQFPGR